MGVMSKLGGKGRVLKTYLSKEGLEVQPQIASFFPTHETSLLTCVQQFRSQTLGLTSSRHRAPKKSEWQHWDSNPLAPSPETSIVPLDHASLPWTIHIGSPINLKRFSDHDCFHKFEALGLIELFRAGPGFFGEGKLP